ncbi:MAG: hypothetical protein LBJ89_01170 [Holosporales bacterium]|jgi:hypothetical protein|nr:hypothetical protein [Holosporales bacterium]
MKSWAKICIGVGIVLLLMSLSINITYWSGDSAPEKVNSVPKKEENAKSFIPKPVLDAIKSHEVLEAARKQAQNEGGVEYNMKVVVLAAPDDELAGKTLAEHEGEYYKKRYIEKKDELKKVYEQFLGTYKTAIKDNEVLEKRLRGIQEQEDEFESFMGSYAKQNCELYGRSSLYHYYAALIDLIDLRIRHLKIHTKEFE